MSFIKKSGAVLGVGLAALAGGVIGNLVSPNTDVSQFATKVELGVLSTHVDSQFNATNTQLTTIQTVTQSTSDKILADDVFEATVEGLALNELEYRDYRALGKFILTDILNQTNVTSDDVDELDLVVEVRDTDFSRMDINDQDGQVTFDLRVRYDNGDGHRARTDVTATATIEDGEVEDLVFSY